MSPGLIILNGLEPKRRQYSKEGCRECKRRKIKCDEGKPSCWQCSRLKKQCNYPEKGERVRRVGLKKLHALESVEAKDKPKGSAIQENSIVTGLSGTFPVNSNQGPVSQVVSDSSHSSFANLTGCSTDSSSIAPILESDVNPKSSQISLISSSAKPTNLTTTDSNGNLNMQQDKNRNHDTHPRILSNNQPHFKRNLETIQNNQQITDHPSKNNPSVAISLNNFNNRPSLNNLLNEPTPENYSFTQSYSQSNALSSMTPFKFEFDPDDLNLLATDLNNIVADIVGDSKHKFSSSPFFFDNSLDNFQEPYVIQSSMNTPLSKGIPISFIQLSRPHEKVYLEEFYNVFAAMLLPFSYYDEASKTFINPLRDILLTVAAREPYLLAAILAQGAYTSSRRSGFPEDEKAHHQYLSKCLELLSPALSKSRKDDKNVPASVSITNIEAMLLTVLLLTSANASNTREDWRAHLRGARDLLLKYSSLKYSSSPILVFCKYWFNSIEVLAGLSSDFGGTLKRDEELDLLVYEGLPAEIQIMKDFKLISPDGFNLLFGYPNEFVECLRDLTKLLNRIRSKETLSVDECLRLSALYYKWSKKTYITNTGLVQVYEPKYDKPGTFVETFTRASDGTKYQVSWVDVSHLAYTIAAQVTLLTRGFGLPSSNSQVQQLVTKYINMLEFLRSPEQPRITYIILMIQWPSLVIGFNCTKEDDQFLLMKLFRMSAQWGSGSARYSLRRLQKSWKPSYSGYDSDDGVDIMTY